MSTWDPRNRANLAAMDVWRELLTDEAFEAGFLDGLEKPRRRWGTYGPTPDAWAHRAWSYHCGLRLGELAAKRAALAEIDGS